jgi:hypothetical protein
MVEGPSKIFEKIDAEIRKQVENIRAFAFKDGAL